MASEYQLGFAAGCLSQMEASESRIAALEAERDGQADQAAAYRKRCREYADQLAALEAENLEQARLLGKGSEREAALMGKVSRLEGEVARMQPKADKDVDDAFDTLEAMSSSDEDTKDRKLAQLTLDNIQLRGHAAEAFAWAESVKETIATLRAQLAAANERVEAAFTVAYRLGHGTPAMGPEEYRSRLEQDWIDYKETSA